MGAFNLTIGALLLGSSLNQYVAYTTIKFDDPIWLRTLVAILFLIDTSETIVQLYGAWYFVVENYANPSVLIAMTEITLWGFARQVWLCGFLTLLAVGACSCGVVVCIKAGFLVDVTKFAPLIPWVIVWLAIEAAVNIIVTVTLSRALWQSKTGLARTNTIIHQCIRAAVQSGFFSSVFSLAGLLCFVLWTSTYLYVIFGWPVGRIYSYALHKSLLYTLVIRKELSNMAYGASEAGDVRMNSFAISLRISPVHFRKNTVTDTEVDRPNATSLDQCLVLPLPKGSAECHIKAKGLAANNFRLPLAGKVGGFHPIGIFKCNTEVPLLGFILHETLQLAPSVPGGLPRLTSSDGLDIDGIHIPGDVVVSTPIYSIQRDVRYWDNPEEFRPKRWEGFAWMEMKMMLLRLILNFTFDLVSEEAAEHFAKNQKDTFSLTVPPLHMFLKEKKVERVHV
ncbi:hypothetical protein DL96DRAFT_1690718 [Flagelloscypha sp. PMI_526]|nr:hypothetical protein DL96DRAFT_1690718 [Flagelloscypha sp. PMI_526]